MNIFLATTRDGVDRFLRMKTTLNDIELWVNGGVDLQGIDTQSHSITVFNKHYDLSNPSQHDTIIGTIEDHYSDCTIWLEM